MAYEIPNFFLGVLPANSDLSAKQFAAVRPLLATGTPGFGTGGAAVDLPAASGDPAIGLLQNKPILGEAAAVMVQGVSKATAAGTVAIGDLLMCTPLGKLGLAGSGKYAIAQALENASDGDTFTVLLVRNGKV